MLSEYFLPDYHFFPKALFENGDVNKGLIVNVDIEEAKELNEKYKYAHRENDRYYIKHKAGELRAPGEKDYGCPHGGYEVGLAKSRIHKFGELFTVPTKIDSRPAF